MIRIVVHLPGEERLERMLSQLREMMDSLEMLYQMDVCESRQKLVKALRANVYQLAVLDTRAAGFEMVAAFLARQERTWMVLLGVKEIRDYLKYRPVMAYRHAQEYFDYAGYLYEICENLKARYQQFTMKSEYQTVSMRFDQLIFFLRNGRSIEVYTTRREEAYRITESVEKVLERLPADQFVRCDQGSIANYRHVQALDSENRQFILKNGARVNISRRNWTAVSESFARYLHEMRCQ